ncbi:MAG: heme-binding protein [Treponema sp.]|jgi:uncharacterized protein (UPF0303 family)|nr:heme-binding protein [Treponema sp.]
MNMDKYIALVKKQEELLRFPHFNRQDAWDLGNIFVSEILNKNLELAVSIRLLSGMVLFQYAPEGTNLNNEHWMTRKFNLVRDKEQSSLLTLLIWKGKKESVLQQGLDPGKYVACGGGFPIRIENSGVAGAVLVSGLPHLTDHDVLVECISRYLRVTNAPRIPANAKIPME